MIHANDVREIIENGYRELANKFAKEIEKEIILNAKYGIGKIEIFINERTHNLIPYIIDIYKKQGFEVNIKKLDVEQYLVISLP